MAPNVMAAVSRPDELDQKILQKNKFIKTKMASASAPNCETVSLAPTSCNRVGVSENETQPSVATKVEGWTSASEPQTQMFEEDVNSPDLPSFTIRNYVRNVRATDIRKCWPFPQRLFESCLRYGLEPQLPPFDPPQYGSLHVQRDVEHQPITANGTYRENDIEASDKKLMSNNAQTNREEGSMHEIPEPEECVDPVNCQASSVKIPCENEDGNREGRGRLEQEKANKIERLEDNKRAQIALRKHERATKNDGVVEKQQSDTNQRETAEIALTSEDENHEIVIISTDDTASCFRTIEARDSEKVYDIHRRETLVNDGKKGEKEVAAPDSKGNVQGNGDRCTIHLICGVGETQDVSPGQYMDNKITNSKLQDSKVFEQPVQESDLHKENQGSVKCCSPRNETILDDQSQETKRWDLSNNYGLKSLEGKNPVRTHNQKCSDASARLELVVREGISDLVEEIEKVEENTIVPGNKEAFEKSKVQEDVAMRSAVDQGSMKQENRVDVGKGGDENGLTGISSDGLIPQVCPVCRNFNSTSNTALNAHIDHCLAIVPLGERSPSKLLKHKIKPRKKRSMADICAVAPTRTLEDLELSSQRWSLIEMTTADNVACSPGWEGSEIRRQPRTPLHRGPPGTRKENVPLEHNRKRQRLLTDTHHDGMQGSCLPEEEEDFETRKANRRCQGLDVILSTRKSEIVDTKITCKIGVKDQMTSVDQHALGVEFDSQNFPKSSIDLNPPTSVSLTSWVSTRETRVARQGELVCKQAKLRMTGKFKQDLPPSKFSVARDEKDREVFSQVCNGSIYSTDCTIRSSKSSVKYSAKRLQPSSTEGAIMFPNLSTARITDTVASVAYLHKLHGPATSMPNSEQNATKMKEKESLSSPLIARRSSSSDLCGSKKKKKGKNKKKIIYSSNSVHEEALLERSGEVCIHDTELASSIWTGKYEYEGIMPIDTSAEEANKLLCDVGSSNAPARPVRLAEPLRTRRQESFKQNHTGIAFDPMAAATREHKTEATLVGGKSKSRAWIKPKATNKLTGKSLDNGLEGVGKQIKKPKNSKGTPKTKKIANIALDLGHKEIILGSRIEESQIKRNFCKDGWYEQSEDNLQPTLPPALGNGFKNHQERTLTGKPPGALKGARTFKNNVKGSYQWLDPTKRQPSNGRQLFVKPQTESPEDSSVVSCTRLFNGGAHNSSSTDVASKAKDLTEAAHLNKTKEGNSAESSRISSVLTSSRLDEMKFWKKKRKQEAIVGSSEVMKHGKFGDGQTNERGLSKGDQTQTTQTNQADGALPKVLNFMNRSDSLRNNEPVGHGGSCSINVSEALKKRVHSVSLHKKMARHSPVTSVAPVSAALLNHSATCSTSICILPKSSSNAAIVMCGITENSYQKQGFESSIVNQADPGMEIPVCFQSSDSINAQISDADAAVAVAVAVAPAISSVRVNGSDISITASAEKEGDPEFSAAVSVVTEASPEVLTAVSAIREDHHAAAAVARAKDPDILVGDALDSPDLFSAATTVRTDNPAISAEGCAIQANKSEDSAKAPAVRVDDISAEASAEMTRKLDLAAAASDARADYSFISVVASNPVKNSLYGVDQILQNTMQVPSSVIDGTPQVTAKSPQKLALDDMVENLKKVMSDDSLYTNTSAMVVQSLKDAVPSSSCCRSVAASLIPQRVTLQERNSLIHEFGAPEHGQSFTGVSFKPNCTASSSVFSGISHSDNYSELHSTRGLESLPDIFPMEKSTNIKHPENEISQQQSPLSLPHIRERENQLPLERRTSSSFYRESDEWSSQPMIPQSSLWMTNGSSSIPKPDLVDLRPNVPDGSGRLHAVPSGEPTGGLFPDSDLLRKQENSAGLGLSSRFSNPGNVPYPGEPGVVHIFGNPVFKLMGKNVMITNKDGKPLEGVENRMFENARGGSFPGANYLRRLECMEAVADMNLAQGGCGNISEASLGAPVILNQGVFSSSPQVVGRQEVEASWQAESLRSMFQAYTRDDSEAHMSKPHNLTSNQAARTFGSIEHPGGLGYTDFSMPNSTASLLAVTAQQAQAYRSARNGQPRNGQHRSHSVVAPIDQSHAEVIVIDDHFPERGRGDCIPAILRRGGHTTGQLSGRSWSVNPHSQSLNGQYVHRQAPVTFGRSNHVGSKALADSSQLAATAKNGLDCSSQHTGTLFDIVQNLEGKKDRSWNNLSGSLLQRG